MPQPRPNWATDVNSKKSIFLSQTGLTTMVARNNNSTCWRNSIADTNLPCSRWFIVTQQRMADFGRSAARTDWSKSAYLAGQNTMPADSVKTVPSIQMNVHRLAPMNTSPKTMPNLLKLTRTRKLIAEMCACTLTAVNEKLIPTTQWHRIH